MKIRKLISLFLVMGLVIALLAACGGSDTTTTTTQQTTTTTQAGETTTEPEEKDPYQISVSWWGGEARHAKTLAMIDEYIIDNPHVTVDPQYAPWGDYWTKLATQAAGGNVPDVFLVQLTYVGEYASKGIMRPLQDLVDAGKIDVSNFTPGALSSSSYNGELVGITFGDTGSIIVYNKSLIESVDYPLPGNQMSFSEYKDYVLGLVPLLPEGYYVSDLGNRHEHTVENYFRQLGYYGITNEAGTELSMTKEELAEYLQFHYDLFLAGVNAPLEVLMEDRDKQWGDSLAGNGKIAMWSTNVNQGKIFQASLEDELGMARQIVADNAVRQYAEVAVCSTWAISGDTNLVDESAHFINAMVNDWKLQEIYDMDIGVPGSTVIQQNLIDAMDPTDKIDAMKIAEIELMQDILNTIDTFNGRPAGYGAVVNDLYSKIDEILYGRMTVEQAVEAHFAAAELLLG